MSNFWTINFMSTFVHSIHLPILGPKLYMTHNLCDNIYFKWNFIVAFSFLHSSFFTIVGSALKMSRVNKTRHKT